MKHIRTLRKFRLFTLASCQRGVTAVEYAMILAMIALAVVGSMSLVAGKTIGMWGNVANAVNNN